MVIENIEREIECRGCGEFFSTCDVLTVYCDPCADEAEAESQRYQDAGEIAAHMNGAWG